jgi:UDP-2,4-diacetamido-2,4,6-trideoxy-beta-L-altropyranose hydrolase
LKNRFFIRADGNAKIGLGHLIRTLALAEMLIDDFRFFFVYKSAPASFLADIKNKGFGCIQTDALEGWINDLGLLDVVVLDGYHFQEAFFDLIRSKGAKLICIDDLNNRLIKADILINHSPGASELDYKKSNIRYFAVGSEYALLRTAFLKQAQKERHVRPIKTIFICFGGADPLNLTYSTAHYILNKTGYNVSIMVGLNNEQHNNLIQLSLEYSDRVSLQIEVNQIQMIESMMISDFGIVPASSILFECIACRLPVICGYYIENQKSIYEGYKKHHCFLDAGDLRSHEWMKCVEEMSLSSALRIQKSQSKMIDGKSGVRINQLIKALFV